MDCFASTTTWSGRPSGPFAPQPRVIPNPNSLGPLPRPRTGESRISRCYEQRVQLESECGQDRHRWRPVQNHYLQAKPVQQPWDWPTVRQQILAHDRAISRGLNCWYQYIFLSWEYQLKVMHATFRRMHADLGFTAFVKTCLLFVWIALWWVLRLQMCHSSDWMVRLMAIVQWCVITVLAIIVVLVGMLVLRAEDCLRGLSSVARKLRSIIVVCFGILFLCAGYCLRGLSNVARELHRNDEIRSLMGSIFRGFLSCCIVVWVLKYGAHSVSALCEWCTK